MFTISAFKYQCYMSLFINGNSSYVNSYVCSLFHFMFHTCFFSCGFSWWNSSFSFTWIIVYYTHFHGDPKKKWWKWINCLWSYDTEVSRCFHKSAIFLSYKSKWRWCSVQIEVFYSLQCGKSNEGNGSLVPMLLADMLLPTCSHL